MAKVKVRHKVLSYTAKTRKHGEEILVQRTAFRGDIVDISDDYELARFRELGAVVDKNEALAPPEPHDNQSTTGRAVNGEAAGWSDDEVAAYAKNASVELVMEKVGNSEALAARFLDAEQEGKKRTTLIEALQNIVTAPPSTPIVPPATTPPPAT